MSRVPMKTSNTCWQIKDKYSVFSEILPHVFAVVRLLWCQDIYIVSRIEQKNNSVLFNYVNTEWQKFVVEVLFIISPQISCSNSIFQSTYLFQFFFVILEQDSIVIKRNYEILIYLPWLVHARSWFNPSVANSFVTGR
jgi:hypothetical protein